MTLVCGVAKHHGMISLWFPVICDIIGSTAAAAAAAKSFQSYLTLWDPLDGSP